MDQLLQKLLEQTPVIIVMGLSIYELLSQNRLLRAEAKQERDTHKKELSEVNAKHTEQIKEYTTHIRESGIANLETLSDVATLLEKVSEGQGKLQQDFNLLSQKVIEYGRK